MKIIIALLFLPFIALSYEINGKVIKVTDGDTVTVMKADYSKHKIRLASIDAPERNQPYGKKSTQTLAELIGKQQVNAKCTTTDRYKRNICTIYLNDLDANAEMVARGAAWVYRKYYKGEHYYTLETTAKKHQKGLWKTTEYKAMPPWEWRRK